MKMKAVFLCVAMCAIAASPARAQMTWTDKGFFNVNLGAQAGSHDLSTTTNLDINDELGTIATVQDVGGGGLFDIGGGYKIWRNLAVGLSYSRSGSDSDAAIVANVPDPDFYDRFRPVSASVSGANHKESALHLQGTWVMPYTDKIDFAFSFGPTIFFVSQELVTAIEVSEPGPTLTRTTLGSEDKTTLGINLGVDVNYMVTPRYGVGLLARFTRGSTDIGSDSVGVGGFQIGVGFRYRFQRLP